METETANGPFGFWVKLPPPHLSTTHGGGFTLFSDRVNKSPATKTADSGSIPGRVKPKTIKIVILSFPAWFSAI